MYPLSGGKPNTSGAEARNLLPVAETFGTGGEGRKNSGSIWLNRLLPLSGNSASIIPPTASWGSPPIDHNFYKLAGAGKIRVGCQ